MKLSALAFSPILLATPVYAQQQQVTPSQMALQLDNIINGWAQQIEALTAQNAQLQAKVKELEEKLKDQPGK